MSEEWTLVALNHAMQNDLKNCTTEHERLCCKTICQREIKDKAFEIRKTRKLTPGEESVLFSI